MAADTPLTSTATPLNVSLEDHLVDTLRPLPALLPEPLAAELSRLLDNASGTPPPKTIPYELLNSISKWSRSPAGQNALVSHEPPLPAQDYSMLALLAGTRTSPERRFPLPSTALSDSPDAARKRELGDRRAVTAVLNALLSIVGSALATWWAADRLAWRNEWRVLLALSVAILVATSEGILFLIWEDRRSKSPRFHSTLRFPRPSSDANLPRASVDKKSDRDPVQPSPDSQSSDRDVTVSSVSSAHISHIAADTLRERVPANRD